MKIIEKKEYNENVSSQNKYGEWVPAIPSPYFLAFGRTRCQCGEKFWSAKAYNGHFALVHILGL